MTQSICLNADIGELPGEAGRALDKEILQVVTRCSIACGGHAGDAASMRQTLRMAMAAGVLTGAHPSYPDRQGFGRSRNSLSLSALATSLRGQMSAFAQAARDTAAVIHHVKPHGALYNDAASDPELAALVAGLCLEAGISTLLGPPASRLEAAARRSGLIYLAEGFADRSYEADGSLTPRSLPGAVLTDPEAQAAQALQIVRSRQVTAHTGETIALNVSTLCLHGDTPGAAKNADRLRRALEQEGIEILP